MSNVEADTAGPHVSPRQWLANALTNASPLLLFGIRLWASVTLALYVAFWLQLDNAFWAGTSAAIVCQPRLGASLRKGWFRLVGTLIGAVAIIILTACVPQQRLLFLAALAVWGAICAFASTLLRNYASYSAALAGYTVAIIATDQLGAVGGPDGAVFTLAVARATEICIGIVCAGLVLAVTDLGRTRRGLASTFAGLLAEIARPFLNNLAHTQANFDANRKLRRELLRRVIDLDPTIDEALGESSDLRYHSSVLQTAVDGLFTALANWRAVAVRLKQLGSDRARQDAETVLHRLPGEMLSAPLDRAHFLSEPATLRRICESSARRLVGSHPDTPSDRLLTIRTSEVFAGLGNALNALALLTDQPVRPVSRRFELRIPDMLSALTNGARAFITIAIVEIFWIATAWPGGAGAITWTAITVILFAPRADQAYLNAFSFAIGNCFAAAFAAFVLFAVLPHVQTFIGFALVIGLYLVPFGALMAQPWQRTTFIAMTANFIPLLAPANQMTYDVSQYCNAALALVSGCAIGVLSFRLLPPLSPAARTRRLLKLTLRELRQLAIVSSPKSVEAWRGLMYGRLAVMPAEATSDSRAELLAALSVGTAIIRLRRISGRLNLGPAVTAVLAPFARGDNRETIRRFAAFDHALTTRQDTGYSVLRLRSLVLMMAEALEQHAAFFDSMKPT